MSERNDDAADAVGVAAKRTNLLAELKRRNVLRAALLYIGAVWALAQGIAQLSPAVGLPDWATRWFLIAAAIGFPFWIAFAWFYEFTSQGLKRESDIALDASITRSTGRRMDRAIIGVLAIAVVLLLTNTFVWKKGAGLVKDVVPVPVSVSDKSVAVLPLANDSGDKDQQYFSDGLSDDLINALMQFDNLKVIGRASAFQFRDSKESSAAIGAKLGVAYLVTGSVRKHGDTVRINAQLVKAADGSGVWSQSYDRPYTDLFKLQDDITAAVAGALKAKLLQGGNAAQNDRPPSGSLAAYSAYQQGRFYHSRFNNADLGTAVQHYREAVRIDPDYALAWSALGAAQAIRQDTSYTGEKDADVYAQVQIAVDNALRLNPSLPRAHTTRGYLLTVRDYDWQGAAAEYRRAYELAPNDPLIIQAYARNLNQMGQAARAIVLSQQALALDPLQAGTYNSLAIALLGTGRLLEAQAAMDKALELQPAAINYREGSVRIAALRGDFATALATAQSTPPGEWHDFAMAAALQIGPDRAAADAALQNLIDKRAHGMAYQIAQVYGLRGDPDNVFLWLDRAWDNHDTGVSLLLGDACITRYRNDPRFAAFAKKVGLPTTIDVKAWP